MKKSNEINIGEAIRLFIKEYGMEERVLESMAIDAWHDQMGDFMKKYTETLYVKNRVLFVKISAPSLKNELQYGKSKIQTHINEYIQQDFIKEIRFL